LFQILSAAMPQIPQTTACVCAAQPPGRAAGIPSADLLHDFEGAQARVGTKQKRQGQFQAVAQRAQIFGAVGDTTDTYREFVVNASTDSKTFQIFPGQRQSGIGGEVMGSFWIINHVM